MFQDSTVAEQIKAPKVALFFRSFEVLDSVTTDLLPTLFEGFINNHFLLYTVLDAHWIENQSYKEQFEIVEGQNLLKLSTKYNFFPHQIYWFFFVSSKHIK